MSCCEPQGTTDPIVGECPQCDGDVDVYGTSGKPVFFEPEHAQSVLSTLTTAAEHIEARTELYLNDYDCLMGVLAILKPPTIDGDSE